MNEDDEPTDRERAEEIWGYLADFSSGKGRTEADFILWHIQQIRAEEREACAEVVEDADSPWAGQTAHLIRSRGKAQ